MPIILSISDMGIIQFTGLKVAFLK